MHKITKSSFTLLPQPLTKVGNNLLSSCLGGLKGEVKVLPMQLVGGKQVMHPHAKAVAVAEAQLCTAYCIRLSTPKLKCICVCVHLYIQYTDSVTRARGWCLGQLVSRAVDSNSSFNFYFIFCNFIFLYFFLGVPLGGYFVEYQGSKQGKSTPHWVIRMSPYTPCVHACERRE